MGEKGAEVAPIPAPPTAEDIANLFPFGAVGAAPTAGSTTGTTATAQPIGELGSELSGALPEGLTPSVPTLTAAPAPVPTSPHLDGLQPSIDVASDAAGPGDALRP
jgi:hypothetical protein